MNEESIDYIVNLRHTLATYKNFFSEEEINGEILYHVEELLKLLDLKLKAECRHEYVEDYIDVDPEKSQKVCYCNKCWTTFPINN
jgi:hypothetical protein